jgi:hypothetical protein
MTDVAFDLKDQLKTVEEGLLDGETLYAVYDGKGAGTGFIGLTDLRVVLQDESYVGGKIALTSLPYNRIYAVALVANKSVFGRWVEAATLAITSSDATYEIEMRGHDKARHAHDLILHFITRG